MAASLSSTWDLPSLVCTSGPQPGTAPARFFFGRRPLPFGGSHLRLPSGPAGIRTTTGSLSALARPTPYQLSHRVALGDRPSSSFDVATCVDRCGFVTGCCETHCNGCMNVAWAMFWGGSRSTKPCVFPCKVAAAVDERYLVCATGAAAVVLCANCSSYVFCNEWLCLWLLGAAAACVILLSFAAKIENRIGMAASRLRQ